MQVFVKVTVGRVVFIGLFKTVFRRNIRRAGNFWVESFVLKLPPACTVQHGRFYTTKMRSAGSVLHCFLTPLNEVGRWKRLRT